MSVCVVKWVITTDSNIDVIDKLINETIKDILEY